MSEMTPAWRHNAQVGESIPEITPKMTLYTQRPWASLREENQVSGKKMEERERNRRMRAQWRGRTGHLRVMKNSPV